MLETPQLTEEQRKELEEKIKKMSPEELKELQKKQCIFCQIAAGKIPAKILYEDQKVLAFLDINPATKGHVLLLPKEHYSIMPQIPDEEMTILMTVVKRLSQVLLRILRVEGTTIFVANGIAAGQRAQHFILHLIPRKEGDGIVTVTEKFLDNEMQANVAIAIEKKLNDALGLKKEIIREPESPPVKEQLQKAEKAPAKSRKKKVPEQGAEKADLDDIADLFK